MGLFDIFKKKESLKQFSDSDIVSPMSGKIIQACDIEDQVFAQEMMGQTIGIIPTDGKVVSPVNGKIIVSFPTGHAFGVLGNDGNSYLVHIGIDTVSLNGKGFKVIKNQGEVVQAGQVIVEADLEAIKNAGLKTTTMLIVTEKKNPDSKVDYIDCQNVEKGQKINI